MLLLLIRRRRVVRLLLLLVMVILVILFMVVVRRKRSSRWRVGLTTAFNRVGNTAAGAKATAKFGGVWGRAGAEDRVSCGDDAVCVGVGGGVLGLASSLKEGSCIIEATERRMLRGSRLAENVCHITAGVGGAYGTGRGRRYSTRDGSSGGGGR
jgi:hypothetical protein